jgi:serine/threonine protein kinase/tetratricopeptide (TPR) repeat protein
MLQPDVIESIFQEALDRPTPKDRAEFVEAACAGDSEALRRVRELLAAHDQSRGPLDAPLVSGSTVDMPAHDERPGTQLGPYKLIEQIGEGGMGSVWMAQQVAPVKRLVAVKLIKAGMDSKQVIARFEAERQALALMDHPNIARVLDAGTTEAGRPYFVMDLVKGVAITKYCDDHHLTPQQRLELFVPVCQAVQHAHQKGIIHRDIKPSNVLVALYDGKPVSKVIDFGVAKAAGQSLTDKTLVTGFGAIVGTLEYMSPEQAEANQLDIDTRSDIYSLGVLLYELLAGSTPFSKKDLEKAGMLEMLRVIREQEPSKPSTKLSTADGLPTLAANRGTEPAKLTKLLRGELDWIVMRALEKDRARRYETANGFAADVQRYLAGESVQAVPPSAGYRLRKFVRRNKGPAVAAATVLLTLLGGIAGTSVGLVRAERARQAESERADAEARAKREAEEREAETRTVLDLVDQGILIARIVEPNPITEIRDTKAKARRIIEQALPFVDQFNDRPLIEARLRMTLAQAFDSMAESKLAAQQLERARALYEEHRGLTHPDTLVAIRYLAALYEDLGRLPDTLKLLGATWEQLRDKLGPDHHETLMTRMKLAYYYDLNNQHLEGLKLRKEIVALVAERNAPLEPGHAKVLREMWSFQWHSRIGGAQGEIEFLKQILDIQRTKLAPAHADTLATMKILANFYAGPGREVDAIKILQDVLKTQTDKLGRDDPETTETRAQLMQYYITSQKYDDALKLCREMLAIQKAKLGPANGATKANVRGLAYVADNFDTAGGLQEGLKLREEVLPLWKSMIPANDPETPLFMDKLINSYTQLARQTDALKLREEALKIQIDQFTGGEPLETIVRTRSVWYEEICPVLDRMIGVADSYTAANRHAEAKQHYRRVLELCKALIDKKPESNEHLSQFRNLAALTATKLGVPQPHETRKVNEAEAAKAPKKEAETALAEAKKLAEHPDVHFAAGRAYARNGQWKKAAAEYDRGLAKDPSHLGYWREVAVLHLGAGDTAAYRRACREMLDRYFARQEFHVIDEERTATICSLAPEAVADFGRVEILAQRAATSTEKLPFYFVLAWAKALAEYRARRPAEAVKWLERFMPSELGIGRDATVFAALAMAKYRLGEAEKAKEFLAKAKTIVAEKMPDPAKGRPFGPDDWRDWLQAEILIREAEEVLKEKVGDKKPKSKKPD